MTTSGRLEGKVAVITGAASGIGRHTALTFAEEGAVTILVDRDGAGLAETATQVGQRNAESVVAQCDLLDPEQVHDAITVAASQVARVDILVNGAGVIGPRRPLEELTVSEWDLVVGINARGTFIAIKEVAPWIIRGGNGGRIVNVSSMSARRTRAINLAYASSKAAVEGLTRAAAGELAKHDINVNAVAPGIVNTGIHGASDTEADRQARARSGPSANLFGRVAEVEDIAGTILFLCLPQSRQITAQVVHVNAGAITS